MKKTGIFLGFSCLFFTVFGAAAQLPSNYDARDHGLITNVKNQSALGTCWSFSATSILETGFIKAGFGSAGTTDFSEWQMANYAHPQSWNGYIYPYADGYGWGGFLYDPIYYAQAQFSSVFVNESDAPYPSAQITAHETLAKPPQKKPDLGEAIVSSFGYALTSGDRYSTSEMQNLKNQVLNHGSVSVGIEWAIDAVSTFEGNVVYNNTTEAIDGGHAITVVGWDDSVRVSDSQQGAFITKNSWSEEWGNDGYFYLAYDSYVGTASPAQWLEVKEATHLTSAYSAMPDLNGSDESYPMAQYIEGTASAIAVKMNLDPTRSDDDMLVSLGLNTLGGEVLIKLYGSEEDALGSGAGASLLYEGSHVFHSGGFQMIDLNQGIDLSEADEVWVVYETASGSTWGYAFADGALTEDYCYFLNGDTWEGSSTTNRLAPVSFYMIPEPSTFVLMLGMGGGFLILRRLRM
jgi:hypothetical protein